MVTFLSDIFPLVESKKSKADFAERRRRRRKILWHIYKCTSSPRTIFFSNSKKSHSLSSRLKLPYWQTIFAMQHLIAQTVAVSLYETHDAIQQPYIVRTILLDRIVQNPFKLDEMCTAHLKWMWVSVGATKFRSLGETDNAYFDSVNRDKNESNAITKPLAAAAAIVRDIEQSFGLIRIDIVINVYVRTFVCLTLLYKSVCIMTWMRTMTLRLTRTCSNYNHHWQQRHQQQQQ